MKEVDIFFLFKCLFWWKPKMPMRMKLQVALHFSKAISLYIKLLASSCLLFMVTQANLF